MIVGTPDSWDPTTAVYTNHPYFLSSVWSPCGQFVATSTMETVEIRDGQTLEVLSTPQPTKFGTRFRCGLAYSPDGGSLAGCSDTAVVIWDTQTGGMVKAIECELPVGGLELAWSSDGTTISGVSWTEIVTVYTHDVASGTSRSLGTLQSRDKPYLWVHGTSFRIATREFDDGWRINIFQAGSALAKIESIPLRFYPDTDPFSGFPFSGFPFSDFSPTTYRLSVSSSSSLTKDPSRDAELLISDIRSSEVLLRETDYRYYCLSFSPDGSFFAAFAEVRLVVWKYTSGRYTRWRDFLQSPSSLLFSQTSSSIQGHTGGLLYV